MGASVDRIVVGAYGHAVGTKILQDCDDDNPYYYYNRYYYYNYRDYMNTGGGSAYVYGKYGKPAGVPESE